MNNSKTERIRRKELSKALEDKLGLEDTDKITGIEIQDGWADFRISTEEDKEEDRFHDGMSEEFQHFLSTSMEEYQEQHVAIKNSEIVASDESEEALYKKVQKMDVENPLFVYVPDPAKPRV